MRSGRNRYYALSPTVEPSSELAAFIRALRFDHLGEVSTEANFRLQSWLTLDREVRFAARAFADLEARTRDLITAVPALQF